MNLPEPQALSFRTLMSDIEKGVVKIPQFQRNFVWTKEKSSLLLDSMLKGYPIGSFILWKTKESLRTIRNLGDMDLPDTPEGDFVHYVLDGQQRLTSLYAVAKGLKIKRDERIDDFSEVYIDLTADQDNLLVIADADRESETTIRIVDILSENLEFLAGYERGLQPRMTQYRERLTAYSFSTILIRETPLDMATEIFTRINVTGQKLSVFEIMVAKTFDATRGFDLSEKYDELVDRLHSVSYDTIPPAVVLQVISGILTGGCSKRDILGLDKSKFIDIWPKTVDAMECTIDFFRNRYRIPVSRLLPYGALLVPFCYFFYRHPQNPRGDKRKYLKDFFWRVSLGGRYSYSLETRLSQDLKKIDLILRDEQPTYETPIDVSKRFIRDNGWFSTGRSFVKAILCLLSYHQPKSFNDNSLVRIGNDYLKQINSKNYHHFFPRAYLRRQGYENEEINHIANITIVDEFLNKRVIRDKAPSEYMRDFERENQNIISTMKTHLVDIDDDRFGVWNDDYKGFIDRRCKWIARELRKRVILQDIDDSEQQDIRTDDYEEVEYDLG